MKRNGRLLVLCLVFFLLSGILGYIVNDVAKSNLEFECVTAGFHFNWTTFGTILVNNIIVGILVSVGGFFTAGILTVVVLIWNGFLLGQSLSLLTPDLSNLPYIAIHGLPEVFGLFLFSVLGLRGFVFFRRRVLPARQDVQRVAYLATLLTVVAAFLETGLISNC